MFTVSLVRMIEPVTEENYLTVRPDKLPPGRSADDASVADNWPISSTSALRTDFRGRSGSRGFPSSFQITTQLLFFQAFAQLVPYADGKPAYGGSSY